MTNFKLQHRQTVQDFLSGVVVIDDNIKFSETSVKQLSTPSVDDLELAPSSNEVAPAESNKGEIQALEIINSFSELGIHCVAYPWNPGTSKVLPTLAMNTDIAIFDWKLGEGDTDTAAPLIKTLIEQSKDCFRYIVIYTSEEPSEVVEKIKQVTMADCVMVPLQKGMVIDYRYGTDSHVSYRVEIIKKEEDSELCDKVIDGFSAFSVGFLRNVMLNGITSIRKNAFKLLSLYPKNLDKAAISHFTSLQSSSEMFNQADIAFHDYISGLISDNISDILLYSSSLKKALDGNVIVDALSKESGSVWVHSNKTEIKNINYASLIKATSHDAFKKIIMDGLQNEDEEKLKDAKNKIAISFDNSRESIRIENDIPTLKEFSHNDCCRGREKFSSTESPFHPLKFGTIVIHDDIYYLCLQPLCDSIRLKGETTFPFVKLEVRPDKKSFSYVAKKEGDFIALKAVGKPHQSLYSYEFSADIKTKDVRTDENNIFKDTDSKDFIWVSELKEAYAQGIAHNIASQGTRIGMDQFEWLRLKS